MSAHAFAGMRAGFLGSSPATASATLLAVTRGEADVQGDAMTTPTLEDTALKTLTCAIDEERGREMDVVIGRGGCDGRNLKEHIKSIFIANTEEGTRTKQGD